MQKPKGHLKKPACTRKLDSRKIKERSYNIRQNAYC